MTKLNITPYTHKCISREEENKTKQTNQFTRIGVAKCKSFKNKETNQKPHS